VVTKIKGGLFIRCNKCKQLYKTNNPESIICPVCKAKAKTVERQEILAVMTHGL